MVESDSDWEAGGACALASDSSSLPGLQDVSDSDIWSDTDSVYVKEESGEESEEVSSVFGMEDVTIPDLPDGFEEDWSDIQSFRSGSDSDRVISLESDSSSEPVAPVSKASDVPSSARSELYDSGCSRHISPYRDNFSDFQSIPPKSFRAANKQKFDAVGTGSITVDVPNGVDVNSLHLTKVLYSPEVGYTLISMGRLDDHGFSATFADGKCTIRGPDGDLVGEVPKTNRGLYRVDRGGVEEDGVAAVETVSLDQLHRRMGHISPKVARHMVTKGFVTGVKLDNEGLQDIFCESCVYAKATRKPVTKKREEGSRAKKFGEEVHSDLWGPAPVQSLRGKRYYISFIDDSSRYTYLEFLRCKNEAFRAYLEYEAWVKTTFDAPVKTLHSDNGGEYTGKEFVVYLKENGTHQKLSVHDTPQHNGVAERYNRTLVEKIRAMLHSSGLPRTLWAEAARHAVWILNHTLTKSLDGKTPLEAATGKKPDLRELREWGIKVWVRLEKGDKLGGRVKEGRWVGVSEKHKGFRIYWPNDRRITVERNVYVNRTSVEIDRVEGEDWEFDLPIPEQNTPLVPTTSTPPPAPPSPPPADDPAPASTRRDRKPSQRVRDILEGRGRSSNKPRDPIIPTGVQLSTVREDPATVAEELEGEDEDWVLLLEDEDFLTEYAMVLETLDSEALEPHSLAEAKRRPDWPLWEKAIEEELKLLREMGTWEVVERPEGVNVVGSKWVFKAKKDAAGNVVRYKARLVAQGFSQVPGVNYFDTYAPVARMASIRAILAMAAHFDMELHQIDIKGAYLNGRLTDDEKIFMSQPPGYPTPGTSSQHVLRLLKTLYGLKQSGRRWYQRLVEILVKNLGFTQCEVDQAVFFKREGKERVVIAVHVDDCTIAATTLEAVARLKEGVRKHVEVSNLGELHWILGIEVRRDRDSRIMALSQHSYLDSIIRRYGFEDLKPVSIPMDPNVRLSSLQSPSSTSAIAAMRNIPYHEAIGSLMWASLGTRPDILFAVTSLSRFTKNPGEEHWNELKRVFRYLKGTKDLWLKFGGNSKELVGYADADGNMTEDRHAITGYAFILNGGAISWASKHQEIVTLSTTESEYVAATHATKEGLWLRSLLTQVFYPLHDPTTLFSDNQSAIALTKDQQYHARMKHIDIRYHLIRWVVNEGTFRLVYCPTNDMVADVLTEALPSAKVKHFASELGLGSL